MKFVPKGKGVECLSDSGNTYFLTMTGDEPVFCTCKGFKFSGHKKPCRHIAAYLAQKTGKNVYDTPKKGTGMETAAEKALGSPIHDAATLIDETKLKTLQKKLDKTGEGVHLKVARPAATPAEGVPSKRSPQLAEKYDGEALPYPMWMEPKLDGIRVLAFVRKSGVQFFSRSMKPVYNMGEVAKDVMSLGLDGIVLDGEGFAGSFENSISILKSSVSQREGKDVTFVVFDVLSIGEWEQGLCKYPQSKRREVLGKILMPLGPVLESDSRGFRCQHRDGSELKHLRLTPMVPVVNILEVKKAAMRFLEDGFEGGMLKDPNAPYRCDRGSGWRKVKFVDDYDVVISGVQAGKGKHDGRLGAVEFSVLPKGFKEPVVMEAGTGFSDEEREEMWALHQNGKLIGRTCEVGLQQRPSAEGHSLFAVFRRMRPDKEAK